MRKNIEKITCCFLLVFFSVIAISSQPIKAEGPQGEKAVPGVLSLLLDDVIAPESDIYPFPDTGQDECYNNTELISCPSAPTDEFYGQDAQYPRIDRSYTKLGQDGAELDDNASHIDDEGAWIMTRDNVTGLIWEIKTDANKADTYTWQNAEAQFIAELNGGEFGGFSDWRLPSRAELASLVDRGRFPSIDPFWFPNTIDFRYWSSSAVSGASDKAWRVRFSSGFVYYQPKSTLYYVRGVRGPFIDNNMVDDNDGTITDRTTGLIWKKCSYGQTWDETEKNCTGTAELMNWKDALAKAAEDNDWRLPNISELQSLVDDSASAPAIYEPFRQYLPPAFDSPDPDHTLTLPYWSSTTLVHEPTNAWLINFVDGSNNYDGYNGDQGVKTDSLFYIRLVRTAQ